MTVKELKEKIKDLPDYMEIMIEKDNGEFTYQLLNSADVKPITFHEGSYVEDDEQDWPEIDCLVLSDE